MNKSSTREKLLHVIHERETKTSPLCNEVKA